MSLVRFHFSALPCVDFQRICTGNPQADCFLHLGQHPHISYSDEIMGEDGVEPPEPESNRFTVCPATSTEYSPKTRKTRVSKVIYRVMRSTRLFYAVPATRSCFGYYYAFLVYFMLLENSLTSMRACDGETKKHLSDGKSDQAQAYAVTYLCSF